MKLSTAEQLVDLTVAMLHMGPGPHPDGTPQTVHGGGAVKRPTTKGRAGNLKSTGKLPPYDDSASRAMRAADNAGRQEQLKAAMAHQVIRREIERRGRAPGTWTPDKNASNTWNWRDPKAGTLHELRVKRTVKGKVTEVAAVLRTQIPGQMGGTASTVLGHAYELRDHKDAYEAEQPFWRKISAQFGISYGRRNVEG